MIVERVRELLEKGRVREAKDFLGSCASVPLTTEQSAEISSLLSLYTKQTRGKPQGDPMLLFAIEYSFAKRVHELAIPPVTRTMALKIAAEEGVAINGKRYFKGEKSIDAYYTRRGYLFE